MKEKYIDRNIAFFNTVVEQLRDFNRERFRKFYHECDLFERFQLKYGIGYLDICKTENVDFISHSVRHTTMIAKLHVEIFGFPNDKLITEFGELTNTCHDCIKRIESFSSKIFQNWDASFIKNIIGINTLVSVDFKLYIGRRALGLLRYEEFKEKLLSIETPRRIFKIEEGLPSSKALLARKSDFNKVKANAIEVMSYDTILDNARAVALDSYPYKDQELLKKILSETTDPNVILMALERLDKTSENGNIFQKYLSNKDTEIKCEAVLGTLDIGLIRTCLTNEDSLWIKEVIEARIADLERNEERLAEIGKYPKTPPGAYVAIAAISNLKILNSVCETIKSKANADSWTQDLVTLIKAKEASLNGDIKLLDELLKEAAFNIRYYILKMKSDLINTQQIAPKVFISYKHESHSHNEWVKKLAKDLRKHGINALIDEWEIDLGESISDYMAYKISSADSMLFVITEESLAAVEANRKESTAIRFEFQIANARRYHDHNFRIIGLLRSGIGPPSHISDNLYIDFKNDKKYKKNLDRLIKSLHGEYKEERPLLIPRRQNA